MCHRHGLLTAIVDLSCDARPWMMARVEVESEHVLESRARLAECPVGDPDGSPESAQEAA
jgi:hypothetical protein